VEEFIDVVATSRESGDQMQQRQLARFSWAFRREDSYAAPGDGQSEKRHLNEMGSKHKTNDLLTTGTNRAEICP